MTEQFDKNLSNRFDGLEVTELQKWVVLSPKNNLTGCAIVVDVKDTPPEFIARGFLDKTYVLQTDFGNILEFTEVEVKENYNILYFETDPWGRSVRQKELLEKSFDKYYKDLI